MRKAQAHGSRVIFKDSTLSVTRYKLRILGDTAAEVHALNRPSGQSGLGAETGGLRQTVLGFVLSRSPENTW